MLASASVTTTAAQVVAPRYDRRFLFLQNVSDTDMFLKLDSSGTALTTGNGLRLVAGGAPFVITCMPGEFIHGVSAIHGGTGSKDLRIQED